MIGGKVMLEDDTEVWSMWVQSAPRVGEYLWIAGGAADRIAAEHGASSFLVKTIAHWCSAEWSPATHTGEPDHTICAYVEPVMPA